MSELKDIAVNNATLSAGLRERGERHTNYKMYTSMERAMAIVLSGELFLSNGTSWNDIQDKRIMQTRHTFATCFSVSTKENIAMWMLYGKERGKQAAMLNFYPSVMKELISLETIELGEFDKRGYFSTKHVLQRTKDQFDIFLSDVVYTDECKKDGRIILTLGEEHFAADCDVLNEKDIFYKNYSWAYEKECRLVVRLSDKWNIVAQEEKLNSIRIKMSKTSLSKMSKDRLVRSPVYTGGVSIGEPSLLTDKINWEL